VLPVILGGRFFVRLKGRVHREFDSYNHLNAWVESDARKSLLSRAGDLLAKGHVYEIRTGIGFLAYAGMCQAAEALKTVLLILSALYPLKLITPYLLTSLFRVVPPLTHPLIRGLFISAVVVGLMTFVVMPHYTRLAERWLYEETE
jgi:antibiotic biosynthesis monooxygenase (ABM) superfamily enzyme